jgi:6-phosphogluconate dehydrogenase
VEKILDKTGMKGTGKWTVQQAAELSVAAPTIEASLDGRFLSGLKVRACGPLVVEWEGSLTFVSCRARFCLFSVRGF